MAERKKDETPTRRVSLPTPPAAAELSQSSTRGPAEAAKRHHEEARESEEAPLKPQILAGLSEDEGACPVNLMKLNVEVPKTLSDWTTNVREVFKANATFGDWEGACGVWRPRSLPRWVTL